MLSGIAWNTHKLKTCTSNRVGLPRQTEIQRWTFSDSKMAAGDTTEYEGNVCGCDRGAVAGEDAAASADRPTGRRGKGFHVSAPEECTRAEHAQERAAAAADHRPSFRGRVVSGWTRQSREGGRQMLAGLPRSGSGGAGACKSLTGSACATAMTGGATKPVGAWHSCPVLHILPVS